MRITTVLAALTSWLALTGCGDDTGDGSGTTGAGNTSNGGQGSGGDATGGTATGGDGTGNTGGGSGLLPFGADCTEDEECESGLCYPFGMGPKCTVLCPADPADCPGPTKECNEMDPPACKV